MLMLAGERNDSLIRAFAFFQIVADRMEVLHCLPDTAGNHHCPCLSAYFALGQNLFVEVIHHDLGPEPDCVVVAFDRLLHRVTVEGQAFCRSVRLRIKFAE